MLVLLQHILGIPFLLSDHQFLVISKIRPIQPSVFKTPLLSPIRSVYI